MDKRQRKQLIRILIAAVLFAAVVVFEHVEAGSRLLYLLALDGVSHHLVMFVLYLVPYLVVGHDVIRKCVLGIAHGQMFDESFLMTLATIGAFGCKEFEEAVAVMLFYQVGEFFQNYAVGKSRNAIQELMSIAPDYANREMKDGSVEVIDPDDVEIGDILIVKPGEKIPVDGIVVSGEGLINTSALTGESMPQFVKVGDDIISGCINGENLIKIKAGKLYDDSTVAQILEMVENAATKKSKTEAFITRFAKYYTPIVVLSGATLAFVPPIFVGNFGMWVLRACTFLVISCPCALVISVPLAFFGGIGAASKNGVLVKGSNYLEMMAQLDTLVSDKTGTLTEGRFRVNKVVAAPGHAEEEVLKYAAAVESNSTHPIGLSIVSACEDRYDAKLVGSVENVPGKGIIAVVDGHKIAVGNNVLVSPFLTGTSSENVPVRNGLKGTLVHVSLDGEYIGSIQVADAPKSEAKKAISDIINEKVEHVVMLTGDAEETARALAAELGVSEYRAQLLPQDKVHVVEGLLGKLPEKKYLAFVGDGINDAPVLTRADIGIAMGSLGSDAAIEAADIVIMDDNIAKIPMLIRIARRTISISKANIAFALTVKIACLILGALGIANMWAAVFADVGVAMICILNSMRMLAKRTY
ncbi:MAG: cadmium-translocating P-type ATPase [Clostridiales bacterium]|nr:cadmium-translocating P-type ATPase [Candidatus Crickella equi]